MKVFYPHSGDVDYRGGIFLAGPCPQEKEDFSSDWRIEAIDLIRASGFDGNVLSPTNEKYADMDADAYSEQFKWEQDAMARARVIMFWIPRTQEHPALTTNVEFGEWIGSGKCVVGFPEWAEHVRYIESLAGAHGVKCRTTLAEAVAEAVTRASNAAVGPDVFFTSDTHFGQARTLSLSRRPFRSVAEMDAALVSNWNRDVSMKDTVYHLGDFGNPDVVGMLNFAKMVLVKGNYEKKDKAVVERLMADPRVSVVDWATVSDNVSGAVFRLMHEPLSGKMKDGEFAFALFGHVHRTSVCKRNGVNVGMDGNHFRLFPIKEVRWQMKAVAEHYDENVFTEVCR